MHWMTIVSMAAVTYAFRLMPLLVGSGRIPVWLTRGLGYVPIALFAALALPGFVRPQGELTFGPEAIAGIVAAIIAWRFGGKTIPVLAAGLAAYALASLIL